MTVCKSRLSYKLYFYVLMLLPCLYVPIDGSAPTQFLLIKVTSIFCYHILATLYRVICLPCTKSVFQGHCGSYYEQHKIQGNRGIIFEFCITLKVQVVPNAKYSECVIEEGQDITL